MRARGHFRLWFWQWVRTRRAIHRVGQEVLIQRSWDLPFFEEWFLAGLQSLSVSTLVFLSSCSEVFRSFRENQFGWLSLQKATRLLPSNVKHYRSCLWLDGVFSQSFAFLISWLCIFYEFSVGVFFLCVNLSMYELPVRIPCCFTAHVLASQFGEE